MNEALLHFIWQFQYFNKSSLATVDGDTIEIINAGIYNTHQGPDFSEAKIKIGAAMWVGNVELHIKASDWIRHNHTEDNNYSTVILHVVWENDASVQNSHGIGIPVLELRGLVPKVLLDRYYDLMLKKTFVPCERYLPVLEDMKWTAWKERIAIERLQRKSQSMLQLLSEANNHWEEVFWWKLASNFGIKVNAEIFETVARSISINILAKHKNQIHQVEALLLGQAGLLNREFEENYPQLLKKEYQFLQKKYNLQPPKVQPFFLRMRPANFPTVRLAQLAMIVHNASHLFSKVKDATSVEDVQRVFTVTANDYWHYHYLLDEAGEYHPKSLGKQMIENIIINTVVPILFTYGSFMQDETLKDKALDWLSKLIPEKNTITIKWNSYGVANTNALESQSLIELKNEYCDKRRCLSCSVGNVLIRN